jgi:hypothetical protein
VVAYRSALNGARKKTRNSSQELPPGGEYNAFLLYHPTFRVRAGWGPGTGLVADDAGRNQSPPSPVIPSHPATGDPAADDPQVDQHGHNDNRDTDPVERASRGNMPSQRVSQHGQRHEKETQYGPDDVHRVVGGLEIRGEQPDKYDGKSRKEERQTPNQTRHEGIVPGPSPENKTATASPRKCLRLTRGGIQERNSRKA